MKLSAQDLQLINYSMNFRGDFNEKGYPIPRTHDKEGESKFKEILDVINTQVKKKEEEKKKEKDTTPITSLEVKFTLEQRAWLTQMMSIPWESSLFDAKNKLLELLNE